jgi:hypothetical protein
MTDWSENDLDALTALDIGLPIADAQMLNLRERLHGLVDDDLLARLTGGYQTAIREFAAGQTGDPAADVELLFRLTHASVPAEVDPAVVAALDAMLARAVQVGANIACGTGPLT